MHHAAMVQLFALGHMERGLQASAEDRAVGKDGGHMGNEGVKRPARSCGHTCHVSHLCSDSSSQPRVLELLQLALHAIRQQCLGMWTPHQRTDHS